MSKKCLGPVKEKDRVRSSLIVLGTRKKSQAMGKNESRRGAVAKSELPVAAAIVKNELVYFPTRKGDIPCLLYTSPSPRD